LEADAPRNEMTEIFMPSADVAAGHNASCRNLSLRMSSLP
jgi:hypothetical protein